LKKESELTPYYCVNEHRGLSVIEESVARIKKKDGSGFK
jgi:hypothetical protein